MNTYLQSFEARKSHAGKLKSNLVWRLYNWNNVAGFSKVNTKFLLQVAIYLFTGTTNLFKFQVIYKMLTGFLRNTSQQIILFYHFYQDRENEELQEKIVIDEISYQSPKQEAQKYDHPRGTVSIKHFLFWK